MSLIDRTTGQVRIGDAEREAAVSALGDHYAAGRLDLDEYDERTSRAFAARVQADLWPLFRDLPAQPPPRNSRGSSRSRGRRGPGFAVILLVVLAVVALTHVPWPLVLLAGWIWWRASRHRRSWGQSSGSRRAVRGTCS